MFVSVCVYCVCVHVNVCTHICTFVYVLYVYVYVCIHVYTWQGCEPGDEGLLGHALSAAVEGF